MKKMLNQINRVVISVLLTLILAASSSAWTVETGTIRDLVMGDCPNCAYGNWTAHISEGIARAGYNDYGPEWLDEQTDGFGNYTLIPDNDTGDSVLADWKRVFAAIFSGNLSVADSILQLHEQDWRYDLVEFWDDSLSRTFYVLRERLDSSFVDINNHGTEDDDIIGGFQNGWGLFVFNPAAFCHRVVVQMPHPEDDFLSIPVGLDLFVQGDAYALMIAGAGREVLWDDGRPPFDNNKSLSDPSRNGRSPFQMCHVTLFDSLNEGPSDPLFAIQIHSYDTGLHPGLKDIQMSAYRDDKFPNPPLRDVVDHRDVINVMPFFPIDGLSVDSVISRRVDGFVGLYSDPAYRYYGETDTVSITSMADLLGVSGNEQAVYSHRNHDIHADLENFIHIEIDEYPDGLWDPVDWPRWLPGPLPPTLETYRLAIEYYHPLVVALDSVLREYHTGTDTLPPPEVTLSQATKLSETQVYLRWSPPAADPHFDTYSVYYDTAEITPASPKLTRRSSGQSALALFQTTGAKVTNLAPPAERYHFAVSSSDIYGNLSPLSNVISITDGYVPDLTVQVIPPDSLEFNWAAQSGDSAYTLLRKTISDTIYVQQAISDTNWIRVSMATDSGEVFYDVMRVLYP